jgi:accessory gene regulator B
VLSIEGLSKNITKNLKNQLDLDDDRASVIQYGLFAFFHMGLSILIVAIVGAIFNVMIEALLISFVISIFRKSSGGVHASTPTNCAIIGVLISVLPAYIITKFSFNVNYIIFIGIIVFIVSMILTYRLAPVDSINKPIRKKEKIKRLKKISIIILTIYIILVTLNILLYRLSENEIFLIYSICIYIGVIWQVFTLTKLGSIIVNIIDFLLIKIINIKGE